VRRRRHSAARLFFGRLVVAFSACLILTTGGLASAFWVANGKWDGVATADIPPASLTHASRGKPANYLIVASDPPDNLATPAAGANDVVLSDTIMIAHVDPSKSTGMLVGFPRDLWVNIPGRGFNKIDTAFNDGPQKVVQTIETDFRVPINHYLEIDVDGLRKLVNTMGGIHVDFPAPARDEKSGLAILDAGCKTFNGDDALAYIRSRAYEYRDAGSSDWTLDPSGEFGRLRREQTFLQAVAQVAINNAAKHPLRADDIANAGFSILTKDRDLALSDVRALFAALRRSDPSAMQLLTVPAKPRTFAGKPALALDQAAAAPIFSQLRVLGPVLPPITVPKGVRPADVKVKVLNGSGVDKAAQKALDALGFVGFKKVEPPANADRSDYQKTEVRYAPGALHKAQLVAAYIGSRTLVAGRSDPGADVTVVLGADFARVAPPTTTTTAHTPTTTAKKTRTTTTSDPRVPARDALPAMGC
jgi:LCP family protein required for cell wall assembly